MLKLYQFTEIFPQLKVSHLVSVQSTVANLVGFESNFEPVCGCKFDPSSMKSGESVQFSSLAPTVCVGFLSEIGNEEIDVRDCCVAMLKRLNGLEPTFELLVDVLYQVGRSGQARHTMMVHQAVPVTVEEPNNFSMRFTWGSSRSLKALEQFARCRFVGGKENGMH